MTLAAILEGRAAQNLEFADESFCQPQVPMPRRVLFAASSQCASSTLLLQAGVPPGRVKRIVSVNGSGDQRTKITSAGRKTASV